MVERANNLVREGRKLPTDLWLAHVWDVMDIPTQPMVWSEWNGQWMRPTDLWHEPKTICSPGSAWVRGGWEILSNLIRLLEDPYQYALAYRALHDIRETEEERLEAIRWVRSRVKGLSVGMSMPSVSSTPSTYQKAATDVWELKPMTEPVEAFREEVGRIAQAANEIDPFADFFEEAVA